MRQLIISLAALWVAGIQPSLAADPVTITFWHYQTANRERLVEQIDAFMQENPEIRVEEQSKGVSTLAAEIQAASIARRAPDVGQILSRLTLGLVANAAPTPLDAGPDEGAFLQNILPNFLEIGTVGERPYLVPHSFGVPVLYINRDLFEEAGLDPDAAPRTWEEVRTVARQITEKTGNFGLFVSTGGRDVSPQQMMVNAGAEMLSEDGTRATFATPEGIAAMQLWQDMAVTDRSMSVLSERENNALFMAGRIGIFVGSVASFQGIKRNVEGVFDLGVAAFPTWGDTPRRVPNSGSGLMIFSQDETRRAAAFRFVEWLMRPDVSNNWAVVSGYMPVAPGAREDAAITAYLAEEPRWEVAVAQMDDLVATARWPGSRVVEIQIVLENMVEALKQGRGTAAELVPAAEAEITRLIAEGT